MKYTEPKKNEWVYPKQKGYRIGCCDCGLVHEVDFRIVKGKVEFRVRPSKRATAAMRAAMKRSKKK